MIVLEEAQYVAMHLPRLAQQADDALLGRLGAGSGTLWVRIPFESVRGLHGPLGSSAPDPAVGDGRPETTGQRGS